jgi:hypothetical protein
MIWPLLTLLTQDIPKDFAGWRKEGQWKWSKETLVATGSSILARASWAVLTRDRPAENFSMALEFRAKPDPAQNVLLFVQFRGHDIALNIDFDKGKPRASLGMACVYTPEGAAVFYESIAVPIEGVSFKDWVKAAVTVSEEGIRVDLAGQKLLDSDVSDLIKQMDSAGKEPYSKRIHRGVGLGVWNQSTGGAEIRAEFRNLKISVPDR